MNWILKTKFVPYNVVHLSAANLLNNIKVYEKVSGLDVMPVLKSNAYGHGIKEVAQILNSSSARMLVVDGYFEANSIRRITEKKILVMNPMMVRNLRLADRRKMSFVVADLADLRALAESRFRVKIHLKINTGMNRLGFLETEIPKVLQILKESPRLTVEGVMTHLYNDTAVDGKDSAAQIEIFDRVVEAILQAGLTPEIIHVTASGGSAKVKSRFATAVRPGIGAYGFNTLERNDPDFAKFKGLKPVMRSTSTIIHTVDLKKGDKVGYGGTFVAGKAMRIGVIPMGYYEGIPRALSNQLDYKGRICMNMAMVEIGEGVKKGDKITVFSDNNADKNSISAICREQGLFLWEFLVHISDTLRREIDN